MRTNMFALLRFMCSLCLVCAPSATRAAAPEVLLKTAHVAAPLFDLYRTGSAQTLLPSIEQALSGGSNSEAAANDRSSLRRNLLVNAYHEAAAGYIAGHAFSSGEVIGIQNPSDASAWHKSIISFPASGQPLTYLCSARAPGALLEHVAIYTPEGAYELATISETPGFRSSGPTIYRIRESRLREQLRRSDARQWLDTMLSGERGIRLLIVSSDGMGGPGDTLLILVENPAQSRTQHAILCGWTTAPDGAGQP
jgi:hypothetical protein